MGSAEWIKGQKKILEAGVTSRDQEAFERKAVRQIAALERRVHGDVGVQVHARQKASNGVGTDCVTPCRGSRPRVCCLADRRRA